MAIYPPGVNLAQLSIGPVTDMFGDTATLTVQVTPKFTNGVSHITHVSGHSVVATTKSFISDAETGIVTFAVPYTDQPGWQDPSGQMIDVSEKPGWAYDVVVSATVGRAAAGKWTKTVQPLSAQTGEIDIDLVSSGPALDGVLAPQAAVLSVAGLTGHVTRQQLINLGLGGGDGTGGGGGTYNLQIGTVVSGSTPTASISTDVNGNNFLNLTLVKGDKGADGKGVSSITDADGNGIATITYTDGSTASIGLPPGQPGQQGPAGVITSVTATGIANGLQPTVNLTGTPEARVIALGIPAGAPGTPGASVTISSVTATPVAHTVAPSVSMTGTATTKQLEFKIPAGVPGAGVPNGGLTGQILAKNSTTNQDVTWINPPSGGTGGTAVTDHGGLTGLTDDDHTIYALADGTRGEFASKTHSHAYADITGKPTSFTPSTHSHTIAQVTNLQTTLDAKAASAHTHLWADLTDKPTTFAPTAHAHATADVTGLDTALNGKAATSHTHLWADITDKPATFAPATHAHSWTEITSKPTSFTPSTHTHTIANVTNLQTTLDAKAAAAHTHLWADLTDKPATFTPAVHTHLWADITDKPTTFAPATHSHAYADITGKPTSFTPAPHTHAIADVTNLQTTLDAKAASTHSHAYADITGKPTTFAPSAHTHAITDVTNLQSTLNAKETKGWTGTKAQYDALATKDAGTTYYITG